MPTFKYENTAASSSGVFLLDVPDLSWFNDSILSALAEMTIPENWVGTTEEYLEYAILQANRMMATYKVLNFNPFPVGMIIQWLAWEPPPGYLRCDGTVYMGTEYPELFAMLPDWFKYEDGTFYVPDYRGWYMSGANIEDELYSGVGNNFNSLGIENMPPHSHDDAGHTHGIQLTTDGLAVAPGELPVVVPIPIIPGSTDTGYASLSSAGGGEDYDNRPSTLPINYCIYAGR